MNEAKLKALQRAADELSGLVDDLMLDAKGDAPEGSAKEEAAESPDEEAAEGDDTNSLADELMKDKNKFGLRR